MRENSLLVRINYGIENDDADDDNSRYKAHIARSHKNEGKYMICGGIYNKKGGMIIYEAKDVNEARELEKNNIMVNDIGRKYKQIKKDVISIPSQLIH